MLHERQRIRIGPHVVQDPVNERRLSDRFTDETNAFHAGESVLLTIIPGEQHSFGLSMVAEFFRRAGAQELTSLVHNHWFDIVGFSVSSDRRLDELKKDIHDIRRGSRNRHVGIIIGGPMVIAQPDLVASMGADIMSADATTAPQQARGLIEQKEGFGGRAVSTNLLSVAQIGV